MKVKELIEELQKFNPEAEVRVLNLDYSTDAIKCVHQKWKDGIEIQLI